MGLFRTASRVAVASAVHGRVKERQRHRWAQAEQSQATAGPAPGFAPAPATGEVPAPPSSAQGAGAPDPGERLAQLNTLGELRAAEVLTEAEFEAEKAWLLRS